MQLKILCPICEGNGLKRTIAEINDGLLTIRRVNSMYANATGDFTVVDGRDFALICGKCNQIAFRKTPVLIQETTTLLFGTV